MIFFFPSGSKKKLQLLFISKVYPFYLFEKKIYIFLNYNRYKLLIFTQKNKKAFEHVCERVCVCIYIYNSHFGLLDLKLLKFKAPTKYTCQFFRVV